MAKIKTHPLLGAHTSIAGGVAQSIPRALSVGFTAAQIFVKNNQQWMAPDLGVDEINEFRKAHEKSGLFIFGHAGYLINPCSAKLENRTKSIEALEAELRRAEALHLPFLVLHPGSHGGAGEQKGLEIVCESLNEVIRRTPKFKVRIALENTAGQGSGLGGPLEHLHWLLSHLDQPSRFGVCIDTAHLFEAGHPIHLQDGYMQTMKSIETLLGVDNILAFHVNDSKTPLGSRVDRHEHLGDGKIGPQAFQWLMQDKRWLTVPKVLETPKGEDMSEDVVNLDKLRKWMKK